jgi:acetyl-CoA C-acetyltransferase
MTQAFIYDAIRTPRGRGKKDGALHEITALSLITQTLQALRDRNTLDTSLVEDIVLGCVSPVGEQGANLGRIAALSAGYAETTAGAQVNRFCASGLEACNIAAAKIMTGEAMMAVGGGVESMSRVPMGSDGGAWMADPAVAYETYFAPQGIGADLIATLFRFSREDVDAYAVESHRRAARAWSERRFAESVVPVRDQLDQIILDHDETVRPNASMGSLAALKPSFAELGARGFDAVVMQRYPQVERVQHVHHAGNSSGIVDGAAAVLMGTREAGEAAGLRPRARIKGFASIGSEPSIMLTGPSFAAEKLLKRLGMTVRDIDLFEMNEAFAVAVLRFMQALDVSHEKTNVCGGAIAMGHPLGATGAMLLGTALDELERTGKGTALVTLCVGAGMGTATVIERV